MADAGNRQSVPEPSAGDRVHSVARVAIAQLPILGGPASELFANVVTPPLERRRVDWMNDVADRLDRLEQTVDGFSVASLTEDDDFVTAITTASQIAIRNHREEKLGALEERSSERRARC